MYIMQTLNTDRLTREIRATLEAQPIVEAAGAQWVGIQENPKGEPLVMFRDPQTGNDLALAQSQLSIAAVKARMEESRSIFRIGGGDE
jgi:hypothetical protein